MQHWSTLKKLMWLYQLIGSGVKTIWKTIAGYLKEPGGYNPFVLTNAVASKIKSFVLTGTCRLSTDGPSMDYPGAMACNNGVLKLVDNELPTGYKRIKSITFDGNFHYDTGEHLTGNDNVTMTLDDTVTSGQNVFGAYDGTGSGKKNFSFYIYGGGSTSSSYLRYGDQLQRPKFGNGERTISIGKDGTTGFQTNVAAPTYDDFTTESTAWIGMLPNSTSPGFTGTIIGNIPVGTRLKWIPCERTADYVIGYYEVVNGVFLEPIGDGIPVKGDYDWSNAHVDVVGTPGVITITADDAEAQNMSPPNLFGLPSGSASDCDEYEAISGAVIRRAAIKVFDGTENFYSDQDNTHWITEDVTDARAADYAPVCTHFQGMSPGSSGAFVTGTTIERDGVWHACIVFQFSSQFSSEIFATAEEFKAWLAEQYAAGTPVILAYPLAQTITEQVTPRPLTVVDGDNTISGQGFIPSTDGYQPYATVVYKAIAE